MAKVPEVLYEITWRAHSAPEETRRATAEEDAMHDLVAALLNAGVWDVAVESPTLPEARSEDPRGSTEDRLKSASPALDEIPDDHLSLSFAGCHGCSGTCCTGIGSESCTC